jgi:PAS domain S-box-containing protein
MNTPRPVLAEGDSECYRRLIEIASDWLWEMDADLRFSYFSPNFAAASGLAPEQVLGKRREEVGATGIEPERWRDHLATLAARRPFRDFVFANDRVDGKRGWFKISGAPILDAAGAFRGYHGTGTVVTAQIEAELRVRESEERFRQLFEAASDWFWEMDADLRLTYVSPNHANVTQMSANPHLGKRREEYGDTSVNREAWRAYLAAVSARRPFRDFIYRQRRAGPDGQPHWVKTSGVPVFAADGTFRGYRGAACDVTEQITAEARRRELETQLYHSQKLEALGRLAGGVAHDLNNALVPMLAMTKIVMRKLPEGSSERAGLEMAQRGAERAKELVQQILAFSRKEKPAWRQVDVAALIDEAMKMLQASTPALIRLVTEIEAVPPIIGDAGQLQQVIINLVTNAAQAIGDAAGAITVRLCADPGGSDAIFSVQDTGCGMDAATERRIFEPFFTTKEVGRGTGLGLSVAHGIITGHGGTITVQSRPGQGTRFEVRLPVAAAAPLPAAETVLVAAAD